MVEIEMSGINSKNFLGEGALAQPVDAVVNSVAQPLVKPFTQPNGLVKMANQINDHVQDGFNTFGTTVRNMGNNLVNTTKTFGATAAKNFGNTNIFGGIETTPKANNMPKANNNMPKANNNMAPKANLGGSSMLSEWGIPVGIFLFLTLVFVLLFNFFSSEIRAGYENVSNAIRGLFNMQTSPPVPIEVSAPPPTTQAPPAMPAPTSHSVLESVLPLKGPPEVFNVSKNEFSYYDAEPLCKALGAELATYDQVKDAYGKGADWCNYGWTKGQVAIYPTQKASWDELQTGSEDDREACGKPGVNGGYFDNPEMKFGVNCYGPKPGQSGHDEAQMMKNGRIPMTTSSLKTEEKVRQFEAQANELGILPFNKGKWDSI
jgi:hypothetical protein